MKISVVMHSHEINILLLSDKHISVVKKLTRNQQYTTVHTLSLAKNIFELHSCMKSTSYCCLSEINIFEL